MAPIVINEQREQPLACPWEILAGDCIVAKFETLRQFLEIWRCIAPVPELTEDLHVFRAGLYRRTTICTSTPGGVQDEARSSCNQIACSYAFTRATGNNERGWHVKEIQNPNRQNATTSSTSTRSAFHPSTSSSKSSSSENETVAAGEAQLDVRKNAGVPSLVTARSTGCVDHDVQRELHHQHNNIIKVSYDNIAIDHVSKRKTDQKNVVEERPRIRVKNATPTPKTWHPRRLDLDETGLSITPELLLATPSTSSGASALFDESGASLSGANRTPGSTNHDHKTDCGFKRRSSFNMLGGAGSSCATSSTGAGSPDIATFGVEHVVENAGPSDTNQNLMNFSLYPNASTSTVSSPVDTDAPEGSNSLAYETRKKIFNEMNTTPDTFFRDLLFSLVADELQDAIGISVTPGTHNEGEDEVGAISISLWTHCRNDVDHCNVSATT